MFDEALLDVAIAQDRSKRILTTVIAGVVQHSEGREKGIYLRDYVVIHGHFPTELPDSFCRTDRTMHYAKSKLQMHLGHSVSFWSGRGLLRVAVCAQQRMELRLFPKFRVCSGGFLAVISDIDIRAGFDERLSDTCRVIVTHL